MQRGSAALLVAGWLAGCLGGSTPTSEPSAAGYAVELPDLLVDHDHRDASVHDASTGLGLVGFLDAADLLGTEPARLSDIQFSGDIAAVVVNGRSGPTAGGFFLLNISDPASPRIVARYVSASEDNWYTKFSPFGTHIFLTANGNANPAAVIGSARYNVERRALGGTDRGIHVVDVTDPAHPTRVAFQPYPVRVVNFATWKDEQAGEWLAASVVQDRLGANAAATNTHALNHVALFSFDSVEGSLREVARWRPTDVPASVSQAFPHDLAVDVHPVTGRTLLFAAYWDAGGYVVDVTDASAPHTLGHIAPEGPWDHIHSFKPHPGLVEGRYLAVAAPETFGAEPSGSYRAFDVTDPADPRPVASWHLPVDELRNAEPLLFSPHEFHLEGGRVYASQFHGGVWILRLPDLVPLATWQVSLGDPGRTKDWAVDIETVRPYRGLVWAVDMGSGVLALREEPLP